MIPALGQRLLSASVWRVFNDYSEDLLKIDLEGVFVHFVDFHPKDQTTKSRLDRVDSQLAWMPLAVALKRNRTISSYFPEQNTAWMPKQVLGISSSSLF
jgi:hypothetical protein